MTEKLKFVRIILTVKDIQRITGNCYQSSYREMQLLKDILGKKKYQQVTIFEYAEYNGIKIEDIKQALSI